MFYAHFDTNLFVPVIKGDLYIGSFETLLNFVNFYASG